MHANDSIFDNGANRKVLKTVRKGSPQSNIISSLAFIIKAINLVNIIGFVIATKKIKAIWIFHLICKEQTNTFNALFTAIDIITRGEGFRKCNTLKINN